MDSKTLFNEFTHVLHEWELGNDDALNRLIPEIFDELKQRARGVFKTESGEDMLQASALVNEVYLRFVHGKKIHFENRAHFFVIATRMMRRILVEKARQRHSLKRGQNMQSTFDEERQLTYCHDPDTALIVDKILTELTEEQPRTARVLELKMFGEFENAEIAKILDISLATVKRDWVAAKKIMFMKLHGISQF